MISGYLRTSLVNITHYTVAITLIILLSPVCVDGCELGEDANGNCYKRPGEACGLTPGQRTYLGSCASRPQHLVCNQDPDRSSLGSQSGRCTGCLIGDGYYQTASASPRLGSQGAP